MLALLMVERCHQPVVGVLSGRMGSQEQSMSGVGQRDGQVAAVGCGIDTGYQAARFQAAHHAHDGDLVKTQRPT